MRSDLIAGVVALAVVSLILPLTARVLRRGGIYDQPSSRSFHTSPTPRGAGAAQLAGLGAAWGAIGWIPFPGMLAPITFSLLGLADDFRSQRATTRLIAQAAIALLTSCLLLNGLQRSLGSVVSVLAISGLFVLSVNSANFMDGLNGISAIHGFVLGLFYWWLLENVDSSWAPIAAALVGASLAFMPWNWGSQARLFLGDSGSYLLGALLSTFAVVAMVEGVAIPVALAPMTIYFADVVVTLLRRSLQRKELTSPHSDHLYQRIAKSGWSHSSTSLFVAGFSVLCCSLAIVGVVNQVSPAAIVLGLLIVGASYLGIGSAIVQKAV